MCIVAWLIPLPQGAAQKKFSLLRGFNQQPGTASSLQTLGTCVSLGHMSVPRKGGLQKGCLFARWLSFITSDAALALVLAMLQLLLPLQVCEPLSSGTQPCPKHTLHSCRARHLARSPWHPYSQGSVRRGMRTMSGIRHGVGTATPSSCLDFSLTSS